MVQSSCLLVTVTTVMVTMVSGEEYELTLSSDSPAVLDAPIVFYGKLDGVESEENLYRWRWFDQLYPSHYKEVEVNGTVTELSYAITYPSAEYESGNYEMFLTVYKFNVFYWKSIGEMRIEFSLTKSLNGHLELSQNGLVTQSIVSSVKKTSIDVKFHDPSNFLDNAEIRYFWFINAVNYGQTPTGHFEYDFKPGEYNIECSVIADFDNSTFKKNDGVSLTYDAIHQNVTLKESLDRPNNSVKMAIFAKKVISKQPIVNMNVSGDTMLKHGALVDLNIDCTGSAPWLYCWEIKEKGYNITGNETCSSPSLAKQYCEFPILWYFRNSDTYNLLVVITNDVSSHIEVIPVTIYEVASQNPVSIVIIPIVSSIIVVVIIITGVALHAHYRNRLAVEVADFDFGQAEEEELQYKTFWERLRESFGAHFTSGGSDAQSEGSSVSGRRSVQMPGPAGIGYGSIT